MTEPTTTTDESAFLRAILATPEDDAARLVYADWLQENGQEGRAAFIRESILVPDKIMLFDREPLWAVMPEGITPTWERGFVASVTCTAADWLRHADALAWHPRQTVECPECEGRGTIHTDFGRHYQGWRVDPCLTCGATHRAGTGRIPRPIPATAHPVTRVVLTDGGEFGISVWLGDHNAYVTRWIDPADHRKGFTDSRWPGIEFTLT